MKGTVCLICRLWIDDVTVGVCMCNFIEFFRLKRATTLLDCSLIQSNQNGAQASIRERPGIMPAAG